MNYAQKANKHAEWAQGELDEAQETAMHVDMDVTTAQSIARAQVHATLAQAYGTLALVEVERSRS